MKQASKSSPNLACWIDELGELQKELAKEDNRLMVEGAKFQPKRLRAQVLRAQILAACKDVPAESELLKSGKKFDAVISACKKRRWIRSLPDVLKRLGKSEFLKYCEMGLGQLEKALGKKEARPFIEEARDGGRTLDLVEKVRVGRIAA